MAARARLAPWAQGLRPDPARGWWFAAGTLVLATAIVMINVRMDAPWGRGVHLFVDALALAIVGAIAWLAPREPVIGPRPWHSVALLSALALLLLALLRLAQVFGVDQPFSHSGTTTWVMAVFALVAGYTAVRLRSAVAALFAAVAGVIAVLTFVNLVFDPSGAATFRWLLLLLIVVLGDVAYHLRIARPAHSTQILNAAGLAALGLALSFVSISGVVLGGGTIGAHAGFDVGFGWKLVIVASALGLIAYAAFLRERGPGYLGTLVLLVFVGLVGIPRHSATLIGWPLLLLLAGTALLAYAASPETFQPALRALRSRMPAAPGEPPGEETAVTRPLPPSGGADRPPEPPPP